MGTRALTIFRDIDDKEIVVMYRQFDGYPSVHGHELAEFLMHNGKPRRIVNGYTSDDERSRAFNGMACLAAQCVGHFKYGMNDASQRRGAIGSFYLHAAGVRDCGEEYVYTLRDMSPEVRVTVVNTYDDKTVFEGNVMEFDRWLDKAAAEE